MAREPSDTSILEPQLSQLTLAAPAAKPLAEQLTPSDRARVVASQSGGSIAYSEQDSTQDEEEWDPEALDYGEDDQGAYADAEAEAEAGPRLMRRLRKRRRLIGRTRMKGTLPSQLLLLTRSRGLWC
jgi:hypothetical protein